jgi:hypothetical protein
VLPEELIEGGQGEAPEWVWKNSRTDEYKFNKFEDYEDSDNDNDTCPICFAPLDESYAQAGSDVSRADKIAIEVLQENNPECGHVFHRECIRKWVLQGEGEGHQSCPVCRVPIADEVLESFGPLAVRDDPHGVSRFFAQMAASGRLLEAVRSGNLQGVRDAMQDEAYVNAIDNLGNTALMIATSRGNVEIVRFLLSVEGINVNIMNSSGNTALLIAASEGNVIIVRLLLDTPGIDVNV